MVKRVSDSCLISAGTSKHSTNQICTSSSSCRSSHFTIEALIARYKLAAATRKCDARVGRCDDKNTVAHWESSFRERREKNPIFVWIFKVTDPFLPFPHSPTNGSLYVLFPIGWFAWKLRSWASQAHQSIASLLLASKLDHSHDFCASLDAKQLSGEKRKSSRYSLRNLANTHTMIFRFSTVFVTSPAAHRNQEVFTFLLSLEAANPID